MNIFRIHHLRISPMQFFRLVVTGSALLLALSQAAHADTPSTPADFKVVVYSQTAAELFWQRSTDGGFTQGYEITRNGTSLGIFDALSLYQDDLLAGEDYLYRITALDADGNRSATSTVRFSSGVNPETPTPDSGIPKPANLRAELYSASALELFWDRVTTDVLQYEVKRNGVSLGITDGTSYFISGLEGNQPYSFDVQAIKNGSARSAVSSIDVSLDAQPPGGNTNNPPNNGGNNPVASPQNISLSVYSTSAAELFWTNASSTQQGTSVEIFRNGDFIALSNGNSYYDDARPQDTNATYSLVTVTDDGQRSDPVQFGQFETAKLDTNVGLLAKNDYGKIALSGNTVVLPADRENLGAEGVTEGAVYVFTRDAEGQWAQTQKIASDENAGRFGLFAAIDGNTMAISHRDDGDILPDTGSIRGVTVYTRDTSGQWVITQRISAITDAPAYRLGNSIAISDNTMFIQANTNFDGSIVFVYERNSSGEWIQQQELVLDAEDNGLGSAIDIDGNTAIIGDYRDPSNGFLSGAAWIYTRNESGIWSAQQQLQPDTNADQDYVGSTVALDGNTAVLGGEQSDKIYIFNRDENNQWSQLQTLDYDITTNALAGTSVGLDDGVLAVGVDSASELGRQTGAVYIYEQQDGTWNLTTRLASSNGQTGSLVGTAVAIEEGTVVSSATPPYIGEWPSGRSVTGLVFKLNKDDL